MSHYTEGQLLEPHTCWKCGVLWAMPARFVEARRADLATFYCPNGHGAVFRESTEAKLKRDLERERQARESAEARAMTGEQNLAQVTRAHRKMRERVMNGVCPCCNRSFGNLREHMKTEHADFKEQMSLAVMRKAFGMSQQAVAKEAGVAQALVSRYERGLPVSTPVARRLDSWLGAHNHGAAA